MDNKAVEQIEILIRELDHRIIQVGKENPRYFSGIMEIPSVNEIQCTMTGVEITDLFSEKKVARTREQFKLDVLEYMDNRETITIEFSKHNEWWVYSK